MAENAFIFGLAYSFLPDDEKALAWPLWMKVQSYSDGTVWLTIYGMNDIV